MFEEERKGKKPRRMPTCPTTVGFVKTRARTLIMIGLSLGMLMASLDQTVVGTSLPKIVGELGGMSLFSWLFTAYMLAETITIPIAGKMSDRVGRRPVFLAGMGLFLVGSDPGGLFHLHGDVGGIPIHPRSGRRGAHPGDHGLRGRPLRTNGTRKDPGHGGSSVRPGKRDRSVPWRVHRGQHGLEMGVLREHTRGHRGHRRHHGGVPASEQRSHEAGSIT